MDKGEFPLRARVFNNHRKVGGFPSGVNNHYVQKIPVFCLFVFVSNKFCVFQSMSLRYHPCLLCGQEVDPAYQKKLASYRPILPKIVLEVAPGEPVDPEPARLQSDSELKEIQRNVEEAIKEARRRHLPEN